MAINSKKFITWTVQPGGCWECNSHAKSDGHYCRIKHQSKRLYIHRLIYEELFGRIPEGMVIRHSCDNTLCLNPEHLNLGTQTDNINDRNLRKRTAIGERHGSAKLTNRQVLEIKNSLLSDRKLASMYQVSKSSIWGIKNGTSWKHLFFNL